MEGDSTMGQIANASMTMIYSNKGGCANQTFFTRPRNQGQEFAPVSRLNNIIPDIAIFNFGAHSHDDGDLSCWWDEFNQIIKSKEMLTLRKHKKNDFFVEVKSTWPCELYRRN